MSKTKRRGLSFGVLPRYRHPHPERVLPLPVTLRAPETPNQLELLTEERLTSTLDRVTQLTVSLDELPETLVSCRGMTYRLTPEPRSELPGRLEVPESLRLGKVACLFPGRFQFRNDLIADSDELLDRSRIELDEITQRTAPFR